ncbi:MAG: hypothetical protein AAF487_06125 [Bacteroidota bacterium]
MDKPGFKIPKELQFKPERWDEALNLIERHERKQRNRKVFLGAFFLIGLATSLFFLFPEAENTGQSKNQKTTSASQEQKAQKLSNSNKGITSRPKVENEGIAQSENTIERGTEEHLEQNISLIAKSSSIILNGPTIESTTSNTFGPNKSKDRSIFQNLTQQNLNPSLKFQLTKKEENTSEEKSILVVEEPQILEKIYYEPPFSNQSLKANDSKIEMRNFFKKRSQFVALKIGYIDYGIAKRRLFRNSQPYLGLYAQKKIRSYNAIGFGLSYYQLKELGLTDESRLVNYGLAFEEEVFQVQSNALHFFQVPFHFIHDINPRMELDFGLNYNFLIHAEQTLKQFTSSNFTTEILSEEEANGYYSGLNRSRIASHIGLNYWLGRQIRLDIKYDYSPQSILEKGEYKSRLLLNLNVPIK